METPPSKEAQLESKSAVLGDAEVGHGQEHLADLEVDLAAVLEDDNVEYSYESDRSPFAEGKIFSLSRLFERLNPADVVK
jgi:hypothetical protein